jgi:hypothetical protein
MGETIEVLEKRWRGACRLLFGSEPCGLEECEDWLSGLIEPISHHKSSMSGKEVISAPTDYCAGAKWLSLDEVDFNRKFEPLSINEIKDIDSLLFAMSERLFYSGNVVFGKSSHIEMSSNLNDSHYIYGVGRNGNSKYLAYCTMGRLDEDCFGCNGIGESQFCVKCSRTHRSRRCFETWMVLNCSDCYYSSGLENCGECMFSFDLQNRRHCIGNLELEAGKYKGIKERLKAEMAEKLSKEKRLPTLVEIVSAGKSAKPKAGKGMPMEKEECDKGRVESAFLLTTKLIFGKPLEGGIDSYAKWLNRHTHPVIEGKSAASGKALFMPSVLNYPKLPKDRLLSKPEALEHGQNAAIGIKDAEELSLSNAHEKIAQLAFFNIEFVEGKNSNNMECAVCFESSDNYRNSLTFYTKKSAYNFWPRDSEHLFGTDSPFTSQFSIHIYSCTNQVRCFEIDCCGYCSDSHFLHNCENMKDSMFCFNLKNRKNCIGNSELPPDRYRKIHDMLMGQMHDELSSKKDLRYDIYNVACRGHRA